MNEFKPRKIKFKAWDTEHKLLMRLNSIDCNKGELVKKDHVLLHKFPFVAINTIETHQQFMLSIPSFEFNFSGFEFIHNMN